MSRKVELDNSIKLSRGTFQYNSIPSKLRKHKRGLRHRSVIKKENRECEVWKTRINEAQRTNGEGRNFLVRWKWGLHFPRGVWKGNKQCKSI